MAEWETDATAPTMRVLYQAGVALSPHSIVANLEEYAGEAPSVVETQETLEALEAEGMVRRLDRPEEYYVITEHGADYVETEIDSEAFGFIG
jgi:repressor of nif and glnA expression